MEIFRASFFGHREIEEHRLIETELIKIVKELVDSKEYVEFRIGINGEFDAIAASAIRRVQNLYGKYNNCLILVLPYDKAGIEYIEKSFDEVERPALSNVHPKAAIGNRNKWMIEQSDLVVIYCNRKQGGAYNAYNWARKLNKEVLQIKHE